ncbi:MAG: tryptophan synthase subunit alpha [Mariprofundaceae bacterium]|nr:tryptophan synthase subunit alpha [Mariprofundaceae bacterium]
MSRLSDVFARCKSNQRAALVSYLTAGDPDLTSSELLLNTLADQSDILEIGMPFSDPMADGPVIQAASERALASGAHIQDVFRLTAQVRQQHPDLGIVLMGYANIPFVIGFENFAKQAVEAGVDAVLLVDIPPEEGHICDGIFQKHGLDRILLLSPTSTEERIQLVCKHASGFIYYVSLNGITGANMGDMEAIQQQVNHIRVHTDLPVCVGFGVKTAKQAQEVGDFADGVVVGSHFVNTVPQNITHIEAMNEALKDAASSMKEALQA